VNASASGTPITVASTARSAADSRPRTEGDEA
jgi:hypothetical protein